MFTQMLYVKIQPDISNNRSWDQTLTSEGIWLAGA